MFNDHIKPVLDKVISQDHPNSQVYMIPELKKVLITYANNANIKNYVDAVEKYCLRPTAIPVIIGTIDPS